MAPVALDVLSGAQWRRKRTNECDRSCNRDSTWLFLRRGRAGIGYTHELQGDKKRRRRRAGKEVQIRLGDAQV